MKPLAVDLFCGLRREPQLHGRANALVQQLVARRAENPDHFALTVRHQPPSPISFMAGPVGDFEHPRLTACLARCRQIGVLAAQALQRSVFVGPTRIVDLLHARLAFMERPPLRLGRLCGARRGAVALVAAGWRDVEVRSADAAVSPGRGHIALLSTPAPANPALAAWGAIKFIRALCLERCAAIGAEQIVHSGGVA
jgi:hypothetical protein